MLLLIKQPHFDFSIHLGLASDSAPVEWGYFIILTMLIALGAIWWTLRLRKRNESLKAMLNQRTIDLERRQIELTEANNVKQDFLANMSHEIRNPLNGILGIARLMRDDQPSEQNMHLYACAKQLHQMLGQTLDYSSLEAGKLSLCAQEFSPIHLINEVIGMHQRLSDEKGLALQAEIPEIAHNWIGDPVLLRQILINLISNAVKYTTDGHVKINLSYETTGSEIRACFEVIDSGPGIPKNKQDYIFEKFTRLSKAAENQVSGTGLGLALASEMAHLMKGTLTLDAQVQNGARFVLTLPFESADEALDVSIDSQSREVHRPLRGRLVLIADDMDFNRYINKEMLKKMGATVHEVNNGTLALQALKTMHFDFAILDINMPELSGIEVVQAVLADDAPLPPKFVALSADNTSDMQASCLTAGFEHFIEKPLTPKKLKALIDQPVENIPSQPKPALDNSLLNYLADNDPSAIAALEVRYRASLIKGVEHLQQTFQSDDKQAQRAAVHKLKGLSNFKKDAFITEILGQLSQYIDADASAKNCMTLSEKIRTHIEEPESSE